MTADNEGLAQKLDEHFASEFALNADEAAECTGHVLEIISQSRLPVGEESRAVQRFRQDAECDAWRGCRPAFARGDEIAGFPSFSLADMKEVSAILDALPRGEGEAVALLRECMPYPEFETRERVRAFLERVDALSPITGGGEGLGALQPQGAASVTTGDGVGIADRVERRIIQCFSDFDECRAAGEAIARNAAREIAALLAQPGGAGEWRDIDSAPRDGTRFESQDRTNYGRRVLKNTYWYVHPSVQGWVTDEIDCGDYEFEPTHWRLPAVPDTTGEG